MWKRRNGLPNTRSHILEAGGTARDLLYSAPDRKADRYPRVQRIGLAVDGEDTAELARLIGDKSSAAVRGCVHRFAGVAVNLAVIDAEFGGDGWESNPPRTPQQRPANGFEDRGKHQPPNIPRAKMLVRQRDADALDTERFRVPGKQADQEAQHPVNL